MEPTDLTIEILKDIRGEIRATNGRIDMLREELSHRLDQTNTRITQSEIRTATAITELAGSVHELIDHLRASSDLRPRVERCELEIVELKRRLP